MPLRANQVSVDAGNRAISEIQEEKYSQWNQSWHLLSWCIAKALVRLKFDASSTAELKKIAF